MTTETPIDDESDTKLTDPTPREGAHPGGPRHDRPPFPTVAAGVDTYLATDFSGHDMHHVWRVFRLTQRFADEVNADHDVVGCAALTHDLHRVLGDGTGCDPEETLTTIAHILEETELDEDQIRAVQHCVAVHDDLAFRDENPQPETIEAKILRDADNLDAMGAPTHVAAWPHPGERPTRSRARSTPITPNSSSMTTGT